jgi:DNA-binding NarL/FixJ family response regulator
MHCPIQIFAASREGEGVDNQERPPRLYYTVPRAERAERHLGVIPQVPPAGLTRAPVPYAGGQEAWPGCDPVTVAIIEGQSFCRAGIEQAIEQAPDFEVVFSRRSLDDLEQSGIQADVIVLDLFATGDSPALDAVRKLARTTRVLVTAPAERADVLIDAMHAGAHGCVTRHEDRQLIVNALRTVAHEALYFCAESSAQLRNWFAATGQAESAPLSATPLRLNPERELSDQ